MRVLLTSIILFFSVNLYGAEIGGRVVFSLDHNKLPADTIKIQIDGQETITGADGYFRFQGLRLGSYILNIFSEEKIIKKLDVKIDHEVIRLDELIIPADD